MRQLISSILTFGLCVLVLLSCRGKELEHSFAENEMPRFEMGGEDVFVFDPNTCQTSCCEEDLQFMVYTDTMSDYYIVTLEKMPAQEGSTIKGSLVWTSEFNVERKNDLRFSVERLDPDGWIWLWNSSSKIGVAVQRI